MHNNKIFEENNKEKLLSKSALHNIKNDDNSNKQELVINSKINSGDKYKISIIIPTHNRFDMLIKLLNSIFSQTYTNYEIIIIDDVSTDDTNSFFSNLNEEKIKYIRNNKNLGMGLNRQKGYKIAIGDYVIFCDDDDYYIDNEYFKDAVRIFENKKISLICSSSYILYEKENRYEPFILNFSKKIKCIDYLKRFQFDLKKPTSSFPLIVRKSILDKANFKDMKMMNDSSIYLRSLLVGDYAFANDRIIGVYRVHSKNDTLNVKADFIIKNMKEKRYVYKSLRKLNIDFDLKKWYREQMKLTACHFLYGREKSNLKRMWVLLWILKNVSYSLFKELYRLEMERRRS